MKNTLLTNVTRLKYIAIERSISYSDVHRKVYINDYLLVNYSFDVVKGML